MSNISKVALITGASSGIGKELAHIHAEKGGNLVIVARSEDKLNALKSELEEKYKISVAVLIQDLTQTGAAQKIYDSIKTAGIEVDYLINNAGFGGRGKFHERDWQDDLSMIQLNIITLTELSRLFLPEMVTRNSGKILNVSSIASLPPGGPLQSVYFATKHFVTALSYGIAGELDDTNVTVTALLPGATATDFAAVSGMEETELFKDAIPPRTVAEDGYRGMIAGKLNIISGLTTSQKMKMAAIPFSPKKMILNQIKKLQS